MMLAEFKAWFEGYTEGLEGAPTAAQFARIKERVKEISGTPVTERIFIDKYWPSIFHPWSPPMTTWMSNTAADYRKAMQGESISAIGMDVAPPFNSASAMYALGKTEATVQ